MAGFSIKKGDTVQVITGKDKGVTGKVLKVITEDSRVIVEGVNRVKRHVKPGREAANQAGGIVIQEAPIHISNVMLVVDGKVTRVGHRQEKGEKRRTDGSTYEVTRSVRVAKRTGKDV